MKTAVVMLLAVSAAAFGEDAPATMTKLMVKLESPEIPKDSFAAQPKRIYRASARYCRTEENPDPENGIHGLMIVNEPDIWMINRLDNSARHIVDEGPTFNCRMPIFATNEDVKSAADVDKPVMQLEFGRELEYFRPRSKAPTAGPVLQGKATRVYTVDDGGWQLFLFTGGDPEAPVSVVRKNDKTREILWYGEYEQLPFDAKLFARPEGVKIEEMKQ
jgi:hypothetical protein